MGLLSSDGGLDIWVISVGEDSGNWGGNLTEWVSLVKSLSSILLSVDGSDGWHLEGLLLGLLSRDGFLEFWLIGVGRVEHSIDVRSTVWILLSEAVVMVVMLLLDSTDLNEAGLEISKVHWVHGDLVVDSRDGGNKSSNSQVLEHFF